MFRKNTIYPLVLIIIVFIVWKVRESKRAQWVNFAGQTMGTTYSVKYQSASGINYKSEIDSILLDFNNCLSTYIVNSELSDFNRDSIHVFHSPYFYPVLEKSKKIFLATDGAFDPTVMPLVNAWGFGPDIRRTPDSVTVDSLRQFVGFENVFFDSEKVWKAKRGVQLDFSAIAKGYAVDVTGDFLKDQGLENYFVEIGGEVVVSGTNEEGVFWRLGIEDPTKELNARSAKAIVELENKGMATSGNYRNYYLKDGIKYAHTIDPESGYPVTHSLLSATVFYSDCMTADAFATSFMVLGVERSKKIIENENGLEAFLIYSDDNGKLKTYSSRGVDKITILD